jgi:3-phosphoshikimate 1-carboxyvinyltransferase
MQTLKVNKKSLLPVINIPTSKSYANRGLILASLSEKEVVLENLPPAEDVVHLKNALMKVGLKIESDKNKVTVKNSFPECETGDVELEVGEGGTTARFLACMLLLGKKTYRLKLGKRLAQRPWQDFVKVATTHGANVELSESVLTIKGPMRFPVTTVKR